MAHSALRIKEKLCNTPHLISPTSFDSIVAYLDKRESAGIKTESDGETMGGVFSMNEDTGVAFIEVVGPLTYKPTGMEMFCGGTSYTAVLEAMHEAIEENAHTVVLSTDSGGGEAYSMIQTSSELRRLADEANIKLITYVDGMAASAAYGLAVAAHEIIVNPDAEVGSIGVVVRLINDSKALEMEGYERSFVYAGANKIPYAEDGSFRREFIDDIQYKVDALYEQFTGYVAEMRGLDLTRVKSTQAATFMADDAIKLGLANKKMTRLEFFDYLADLTDERLVTGGKMLPKLFSMSTKQKENAEMAQLEALQAQMTELQEALASKSAEFETKVAEMSAGYETKLSALAADLTKALEEKAKAEAVAEGVKKAAEQAKAGKRMDSIKAVVGDAKADALFAAVGGLEDAAFEAVLASFDVANKVQAESQMFTEAGVAGEADAQKDKLAQMIEAKYGDKK